jgi:23S rRNA pseudouridine1911/1915/1917 synthase
MDEFIRLSSPATRESWEIPICFEDDFLLALDKPSRLLTSPDRYDPQRPNVMRLLHQGMEKGTAWARAHRLSYLANAHRRDFDTSGVLLLAKTKPVLIALANQFGAEQTHKRYGALVHGSPPESAFVVDAPLGPHPYRLGCVRVDARHGKCAATQFEVRERFDGFSWIQCEPRTGRTHQIRVHLQHRGFPLVGDVDYGGKPLLLSRLKPHYRLKSGHVERPLLDRVALHAERLTVTHPIHGNTLTIEALLPKDLVVALKYLRQFAGLAAL